ncbi:hypothetical protein SAMN05421693_102129 [Ectothiorhodospira magna]|uniref:UPF0250 protein SAMN05421693_102129 n=1 Tax=Ectothiorhodospira magna TaxID=867345 RepID=A0A1H8ZFN8_9GAMM|nr:DUF493 domain-containing protein [Ectothiorhodospira magna]SEP63181.1 hypothetical protein SAMN05421693_102129 [Ectothiorhodospira magna]
MQKPEEMGLQFPCQFPVKVFGASVPELGERVRAIVGKHVPDIRESDFSQRASKGGRYQAITIRVHAQSQAQMDALYLELNACELVQMTL